VARDQPSLALRKKATSMIVDVANASALMPRPIAVQRS
jgi:hypothetical protein